MIHISLEKNTQLYICGCKTGCLFCNLLIDRLICGERGVTFEHLMPLLNFFNNLKELIDKK